MRNIVPAEFIESCIFLIRKRRVMLDVHLATLYGVSTKVLNQAAKRNRNRFPSDFMFQLDEAEAKGSRPQIMTGFRENTILRSQFVTSRYGGRRYLPYAFTEQGVAMLSSVLRSKRAIQVNIMIMRTFVKLRKIMATHTDLARKINEMEQKYSKHDKYIQTIFKLIKQLLEPPLKPIDPQREKPPFGFR